MMCPPAIRNKPARRESRRDRSGVIIVLTAILLIFLLGMIAFAVDLGFIANTRTELQMAADSSAGFAAAAWSYNRSRPYGATTWQRAVAYSAVAPRVAGGLSDSP